MALPDWYLSEEVAHDANEQNVREDFIAERVRADARLPGTDPMDDATRRDVEA